MRRKIKRRGLLIVISQRERRNWDYEVLLPLFQASGLKSLDYFKRMIQELEEGLSR